MVKWEPLELVRLTFLHWLTGLLPWLTFLHIQVSSMESHFVNLQSDLGSRLSLAVHQDPHFRARHQLAAPSYRGSLAEPAFRGSLADPGSLAVNVETIEAETLAGYHQKHFFETSSYQASPGGAVLSSTGQGLPPFYRGSLALDLPVPASLHMIRGRGEVKDREEAENLDRRGRELNERWVAAAQLAERQRQRGEVENQIRMFNPRSQVLPTVHEFTHDTLVSRFV